jgi:hypothetical protein
MQLTYNHLNNTQIHTIFLPKITPLFHAEALLFYHALPRPCTLSIMKWTARPTTIFTISRLNILFTTEFNIFLPKITPFFHAEAHPFYHALPRPCTPSIMKWTARPTTIFTISRLNILFTTEFAHL